MSDARAELCELYLGRAVELLGDWMKEFDDAPGRGSLTNVLRNALRLTERARHAASSAEMIEQGGKIGG